MHRLSLSADYFVIICKISGEINEINDERSRVLMSIRRILAGIPRTAPCPELIGLTDARD